MSDTDRSLKDHLNTNQAKRERMCLEMLMVQDDFTDVTPRLPKGGPDGGRDLQGYYKDDLFFGAVGYVNDATDTDQHRKQIKAKFKEDLVSALKPNKDGTPKPKAFIFLTNVGLTPSIAMELKKDAYKQGIDYCDIFDRERTRIVLDSNRGYAIRFRYLDIPLSDAEQKDFFGAWADEINNAIGSGLKGLDVTTKRIQFLLESQQHLDSLATVVKLNSSVWDVCKGEFFFQTMLSLRMHSEGLLGITYGGGTSEIIESLDEWQSRGKGHPKNSQYGFGFSWLLPETPQHSRYVEDFENLEYPKNVKEDEKRDYIRTASSSGVLYVDKSIIGFQTLSEPFIDRFQPTFKLNEIDGCMILFDCSKEFADHIEEITIFGGGYELLKISRADMQILKGGFARLRIPKEGKQEEDSHEWATIRPASMSSCFAIDLMSKTPRRYDW
jgi:hypothetical protein